MYQPNKEELDILKYWEENKIFEKTLSKKSPKGNFVFFEGPPTANGKPGIHHILARAFKDIILRFRTMQGFHVERKAGWDTHGLPVELQVEKELAISGKSQIEEYGIEEFNKKCQESVWQYKSDWEKMTKRIGYWLDLENPYITYSNEYIETLWWILKKIEERELLYRGYKVVPQCPRCGTTLSSHEVAQGYEKVAELSIFVKFRVKKQPDTYILSWTTTPWTLSGNVALAVGKGIKYAKIRKGKEYYYLAEALLNQVLESDYEVVEELKGGDLVGLEYEPLFPGYLDPGDKKAWYVDQADFVTIEEGTGVVHTAAMYGEDDFNFGLEHNLPLAHTVDENGHFLPSVKKWAGRFVKDKETEKEIVSDLQQRGLLLKTQMYEHDYPFCWRCDSPLLYYAKDSWFIKMSALQDQLIKNNQEINWVPEYIKDGRFGEWLANIKDWAISRQRYWGTPLPIWECGQCQKTEVIGSFAELEKKTGRLPENRKGDVDPHRPFIDELDYQCGCGGRMKRIKDVFDCWYDSGAMPFAQYHYPFEKKDLIDQNIQYPAEYIAEAIDQTRGWFYTLLAVSTLLGKGASYKNVICLGHIRDKEGKKMSKSKGNVVDPWQVAEKYGVDALRLHLFSLNQPGEPKNFDEKDTQGILRKVNMLLANVIDFYLMYSEAAAPAENLKSGNILDRWISAKLNLLIKETTVDLESYHVYEASRRLIDFINELSTWYLRRSRGRFKGEDKKDKQNALNTLSEVLISLLKVMAPFAPFISEKFYQMIFLARSRKESVHLEDWPQANENLIDQGILEEMRKARKVVEMGLAIRAEKGFKVRQPLAELRIKNQKWGDDSMKMIAEELNVKEVKSVEEIEEAEDWEIKTDGVLTVGLRTVIDEALRREGRLRELIRFFNQARKEQGLTIKDRIGIEYHAEDISLASIFQDFAGEIGKNVLADEIIERQLGESAQETEIDGVRIRWRIRKI